MTTGTTWVRVMNLDSVRYPAQVRFRVEGNGQHFVAVDREFETLEDAMEALRDIERGLRCRAWWRDYRVVIGVPRGRVRAGGM